LTGGKTGVMIGNVARLLLACVLAGLLLGLSAAAYADPPDPTWVGGYWDDDDFDWVVVSICGTSAIAAPASVDLGPVWTPVARVEPMVPGAHAAPVHSAARPRAPPAPVSPSR
jgi:hypothetical protein